MDNLEHVMAQLEKSIAETKRNLEHTEDLYQLLKESLAAPAPAPVTEPPTAPEAADSYHKLLPELKQACSADEVNISDLTSYAMRIKTLEQAGELTEKQLDKLNPYMKELEASCFAKE